MRLCLITILNYTTLKQERLNAVEELSLITILNYTTLKLAKEGDVASISLITILNYTTLKLVNCMIQAIWVWLPS